MSLVAKAAKDQKEKEMTDYVTRNQETSDNTRMGDSEWESLLQYIEELADLWQDLEVDHVA